MVLAGLGGARRPCGVRAVGIAVRADRVLVDAGLCINTGRRGHHGRYTYYRRDERAIAALANTVIRHL